MSNIIAVTGATGQQGGAVVRALLNGGAFKVRGITRNVNSPKARLLQDGGVEMVAADYGDTASLVEAFRGCYGAFLVTNYFETMSFDKECKQGVNLADAAKSANVKHVVWSTMEDSRDYEDQIPVLYDNHKLPHFNSKGYIAKYMDEIKLPVAHLYNSAFMENFTTNMRARRGEDGICKLFLPMKDKKMALVALEDIGKMVNAIFKEEIKGDVGVCSDQLSMFELAEIFTKATGEKFVYEHMPEEIASKVLLPVLKNMFQFYVDHEDTSLEIRNMEKVKSLITPISIEEWANQNKDKLIPQ